MSGITDLDSLIHSMQPVLQQGEYVFCTLPQDHPIDVTLALGSFREAEGLTVIVEKGIADQFNLPYSFVASWITLSVHSSLAAVGLTAAFSTALARAGISCNVVAAFYHDHIFVAKEDAAKAIAVLQHLAANGPN